MVGQSFDGVLDGVRLKRPRLLHRALGVALFDLDVKVLPEVDLSDLGMGVPDGPLGDRPPAARRHDPAKAENRLLGAPEELVDVALAQRSALVVALALDRHPFAARPPSYEVDPDVPAVEAGQLLALLEHRIIDRLDCLEEQLHWLSQQLDGLSGGPLFTRPLPRSESP